MQSFRFPFAGTRCLAAFLLFSFGFSMAPAWGCLPQNQDRDSDSRSIGDYRDDLKTFMKLTKEEDPQLERNAIFNLCQLHFEIVTDSRFSTSQQLQGIRAVIAKRLETYSKDVEKAKLRKERESKKSSKNSSDASGSTQTGSLGSGTGNNDQDQTLSDDSSADKNDQNEEYTYSSGEESDSGTSNAMSDSASESHYFLGSLSGGPNQLFDYAGGRFAPPWDHGEELVDLITSVIDPTFWRRNGGVGSIHYYQPSRVLVIRATQQGNEDAADLLEKLRANRGTQLNIGGIGGAIGN